MEIPFTVKDRPDTGLFNSKIGIWLFLASEVMLFGGLFSGYVFLRLGADYPWPIHALQATMKLGAINTAVLILSSVTVVMAWTALKLHRWREFQLYMGATVLCALAFCCIKTIEYRSKFEHFALVMKDGTELHGHLAHTDEQPGDHYVLDLERIAIASFQRTRLDIGSLVDFDRQLRAGNAQGEERRRLFDPTSAALGRSLAGLDGQVVAEALRGLIEPAALNGTVTSELLHARRKAEHDLATLGRAGESVARELAIHNQPSERAYHRALQLSPAERRAIESGNADDAVRRRQAAFELRREVLAQLGAAATEAKALVVVGYDPATDDKGELPAADPQPQPLPHFHFKPGLSKLPVAGGFVLFDGYTLLGEVGPQYIYLAHVDVIDVRRVARESPDLALLDQSVVARVPELRKAWEHHWEHIRSDEQKRARTRSNGETVENPYSDYHRFTLHLLKKEQYIHFHSPEAMGGLAAAPAPPGEATPAPAGGHAAAAGAHAPAAAGHAHGEEGGHGGHGYLAIPRDQVRHASTLTPRFNTFYSIYYLMTSLHALHVIGGALVLAYFLFFGKKLYDRDPDHLANRVEVGGLFWHFVDLVWIFLFPLLYLL